MEHAHGQAPVISGIRHITWCLAPMAERVGQGRIKRQIAVTAGNQLSKIAAVKLNV